MNAIGIMGMIIGGFVTGYLIGWLIVTPIRKAIAGRRRQRPSALTPLAPPRKRPRGKAIKGVRR